MLYLGIFALALNTFNFARAVVHKDRPLRMPLIVLATLGIVLSTYGIFASLNV